MIRFAQIAFAAILAACLTVGPAHAATISFSGYPWMVRDYGGGPGPNEWSGSNVFVDDAGALHLKISQVDGVWTCAEVTMVADLGFGAYQFEVEGRPDQFDKNIVLGLFNYPSSPAVGPDGTHEIDIEFAQWGNANNPNRLNWTVHPPVPSPQPTHKDVPLTLTGDISTHRFTWTTKGVSYASFQGGKDDLKPIVKWNDAPKNPKRWIPQVPLALHMNLWLANGQPPSDGKPVEIVIRSFSFTPH